MSGISTVTISGYYGEANTGDDALAATIAWGIHKYLRPSRINILSRRSVLLGTSVPAYFPVANNYAKLHRAFRTFVSDLHVYGGGSVFDDQRGEMFLRERLLLMRARRALGHHTVAIGVSLGPIKSESAGKTLKKILKNLSLVCVRDTNSLLLAASLGADMQQRIKQTIDPAILIEDVGLPEPHRLQKRSDPVVLIAPCDYQRVVGGDVRIDITRRKRFIDCLLRFCRESDCFIRLLVMNGSADIGDGLICRTIANSLPENRFEIVPYDTNPLSAFRAIQDSNLVVGMRLHSLVFAYAAGRPFIALDYHPKVRDFALLVGCDESRLFDASDFDPMHLLKTILDTLSMPRERAIAKLPLEEARHKALLNFSELAKLFKKCESSL